MSNEYDLKKKSNKGLEKVKITYPKKIYTEEEIKEKLEGYIKVPRSQYQNLRHNNHIRYFKIDGSFNGGGFVNMPFVEGKKEDKGYMQLKSNLFNSKKGLVWMVDYDNVKELYVQTSPDLKFFKKELEKRDQDVKEGFEKIAMHLKKIYSRIKKLEASDNASNVSNASMITGATNLSADIKYAPNPAASYP